jgi:acyl carrier protein
VTPERARELIEQTLLDIVPDADLAALSPDADIREHLELDSLDFVSLVERLSVRADYRIDEEDYPELRTMDSAVRFLAARAGATS